MSTAKTYKCVWKAVDTINASETLAFKSPWNDEEELKNLELGFTNLQMKNNVYVPSSLS